MSPGNTEKILNSCRFSQPTINILVLMSFQVTLRPRQHLGTILAYVCEVVTLIAIDIRSIVANESFSKFLISCERAREMNKHAEQYD